MSSLGCLVSARLTAVCKLVPIRKGLEIREVEIVEGTHTRTRTRTRESPKARVEIVGKRDLSVRVRVRVRKKKPKELGPSVTEDLFEKARVSTSLLKSQHVCEGFFRPVYARGRDYAVACMDLGYSKSFNGL